MAGQPILMMEAPAHSGIGRMTLPAYGWVAALVGSLPIAAAAWMGLFSRYLADDFCTAGTLRRFGFWESQSYWYLNWSGRFSFTFVVTAAHLLGPRLTPWLPLIALILWTAAGVYFFRAQRRPPWPIAVALAVLVVAVTLEATPSLYQSLFWQTGMVTYVLPLIVLSFYLGWLQRRGGAETGRPRTGELALSAAFAFVGGGFSETIVTLQTSLLLLWIAAILVFPARPQRQRSLALIGVGLLGSLAALSVVVLAPGNAVRQSAMPGTAHLVEVLRRSLYDEYIFLARAAKGHPVGILLLVALPASLGLFARGTSSDEFGSRSAPSGSPWPVLVGIPFATAALVLATIVPYEYAVSSYPDGRVLITSQFVLGMGIGAWALHLGEELGRWRERRFAWLGARALFLGQVLVVAVLVGFAVQTVGRVREGYSESREYALAWDRRDAMLRQAAANGVESLAAASLRHMGGLAELGRDPSEWINRCIAWTYGLEEIVAK